jgi:hypothetical protein
MASPAIAFFNVGRSRMSCTRVASLPKRSSEKGWREYDDF